MSKKSKANKPQNLELMDIIPFNLSLEKKQAIQKGFMLVIDEVLDHFLPWYLWIVKRFIKRTKKQHITKISIEFVRHQDLRYTIYFFRQ
jgi:hypothetical protein